MKNAAMHDRCKLIMAESTKHAGREVATIIAGSMRRVIDPEPSVVDVISEMPT